jgi:hypothetical protein
LNNLTDLSSFKKTSYKSLLNELYYSLDKEHIFLESDISKKKIFFDKYRGLFISLQRKNERVSVEKLSLKADIPLRKLALIEDGKETLDDSDFFNLCHLLQCTNESNILLEKLEEAFDPEKKQARKNLAKSLKNQFGISFADPEKYSQEENGKLIKLNFSKKKQQ